MTKNKELDDIYENEEIIDDEFEIDEFQYILNDILSSNIDVGIDESQYDDVLSGLNFELEV